MAVFDWLFGSDEPPQVTTTTSQSNTLPEWYQEYLKAIIGKAADVGNEPFQAYGGQRLAEQTPDTLAAYDLTRQGIGSAQPFQTGAASYLDEVGGGFDPTEFAKYQSPYTEGVVDRIAQLGERNLSENLLPNVNQTFTGAGQFGSTRHEDFTNRALRDANESILGQQAAALESSQQRAMEGYQAGQQNKLGAAQGLGTLGSQVQQSNLTDAAKLEAIGGAQQNEAQKGLSLAYQDFLEQRDYPKTQVQFTSDIARGLQPPVSSTGTSTGPMQQGASPLAQLAGAGLGAAALYKSGIFKKEGGRVTPKGIGNYADGGAVEESGGPNYPDTSFYGKYPTSTLERFLLQREIEPDQERLIKEVLKYRATIPGLKLLDDRDVHRKSMDAAYGSRRNPGGYAVGGNVMPMRRPAPTGIGAAPVPRPARPMPVRRGIGAYPRVA